MPLLRYTGHPFVDVGVATLTVMSRKSTPADVTLDDLEQAAQELKRCYTELPPVRKHLSIIFMNSGFVQGAVKHEQRLEYADSVLFAFRENTPALEKLSCTFFPEYPAVLLAHRQHVPLLNGKEVANFIPRGMMGLPVSGIALLAIHAMPLGTIKCGRLLAFHQLGNQSVDTADMTLLLADWCYKQNMYAIAQMGVDEHATMPNLGSHKRTRYLQSLLQVRQRSSRRRAAHLHNITGYYFTNYGPSPDIELVRLDNNVADFIDLAEQDAANAWHSAVRQAWRLEKGESAESLDESARQTRRNDLYENLFDLPRNARAVLWQLSVARDWALIAIFLRKVLLMEQARIDTYRALGDRLAEYIRRYEGDSLGFYYQFARAKSYTALRQVLRRAAERIARDPAYRQPLFTYEEFILAFEHPSEGYSQWQLGRDLITFRLLELLKMEGADLTGLPEGVSEAEETEAV